MTKYTVLHLITRYLDGGAETTTKNTLEALASAEADYNLHLGTGVEYDPDNLSAVEDFGVDTVVFNRLRHYDPTRAALAIFDIAMYLRQHNVDIIHTHSTEAGIVGRWAGFFAKTPVVVHEIHGDPITNDRSIILNKFILAAERLTSKLTDNYIAKAKIIRDKFVERGIGTDREYSIIHHGVDIDTFRNADSRQADSDGSYQLIFVGRLEEGKGIFDLLEVMQIMRKHHDVKLNIVGSGTLKDEIIQFIEKRDLESEIEVLGYRSDVPALLKSSDVLILPSYREGTPRVITEALASGTPVVASNIAGIPEQVSEGVHGELFSPGNTQELVESCCKVLEDIDHYKSKIQQYKGIKDFSRETSRYKIQAFYTDLTNDIQ